MTVIPDSIEPYIGYKALAMMPNGELASPSQTTVWPPKKRLEAQCTNRLSHWTWVPVEGEPRSTDDTRSVAPGVVTVTTMVSSATVPLGRLNNPKPSNPLPPGWSWSWEPLTHQAPAEGCHCGIYAVDHPSGCDGYMGWSRFIVEVSLWGATIRGTDGARAQYAYPRRLLIPASVEPECHLTGDLYGIPVVAYNDSELDRHVKESLLQWAIGMRQLRDDLTP